MMISVVIPLYNKAHQVKDTLESVRRQQFTAYEVIIVDDGSTDGSPDVVKDYLHRHDGFSQRVRLFYQCRGGVSAARNKGIKESRNEWIAFLDADDVWTPDYLHTQYELSQQYPDCDVLAAAYSFRIGPGTFIPAKFSHLFKGATGVLGNYFEVASCSHPPLSSIMTIARRDAVLAVGGFPEDVSSGEDLLTWARLAIHCRIAFNKKCMGSYDREPSHRNEDQRTRMPAVNDIVGQSLIELLHEYPGTKGLRQYIGLWYKMRTRIFLSHSMRKEAWSEWKKLLRFHPIHYKTWAYLLMLVSPVKTLT